MTADMSVIEVEAVLKKKVSSNGRELQLASTTTTKVTIYEQISSVTFSQPSAYNYFKGL